MSEPILETFARADEVRERCFGDHPDDLVRHMVTHPKGADRPPFNMVVMFDAGKSHLSESEARVLRRWAHDWSHHGHANLVVMGGACETSRAGRQRRLHALLELFEQSGVPSSRVRHDADWMTPSRLGGVNDLPPDAVWLQIHEFAPKPATTP